MGGRGSGRTASLGLTTSKTSDYRSLDLAWMQRQGFLVVGSSGVITWSTGGKPIASIGCKCEPGGVRLTYEARRNQDDWQQIAELIPIVETKTNFGGRRKWFQCLSCARRCRMLYGGAHYRCRACYRLKYESQYEPAFARAADKSHKLRARLGQRSSLDEPFPPKPKGMHRKTYRRLAAEDERLQNAWAARAWTFIRRLDRRD